MDFFNHKVFDEARNKLTSLFIYCNLQTKDFYEKWTVLIYQIWNIKIFIFYFLFFLHVS